MLFFAEPGNNEFMTLKAGCTAVCILFCSALLAQTVPLQVTVRGAGKDSLYNASIRLFSLPDSSLLQAQLGRPGGNTFNVKPRHRYLVLATAVGFDSVRSTITVSDSPMAVTLELPVNKHTLQGVTVISKKPLLKEEDDKTIVDATVLANSSTNAYEVLEKTPGAVVDQDGNVYLNSTTPATVYINGREMHMSAQDIAALLKSLPAGSISRIELLRTPSARYDASNSGGIVNVVLKKGVKTGTTGSLNARYDQGVYGTQTGGFSINKSTGNVNSYLSYQYTRRNYYEDIESGRILGADTLLTQQSATQYKAITHYIGGGTDIALSKKWSVAYDVRLTTTHNNSQATSSNVFSNTHAQHDFFKSETPISNDGNSLFMGNTLSSRYKIDSAGSEWTNEVDYIYTRNTNEQLYTNQYLLPPAPSLLGDGDLLNTGHVVAIKSAITIKLPWQTRLESGFSISNATNNNAALYYKQTGNGPRQPDNFQTNTFRYKENIDAGYLQLTRSFWGTVAKAGLRLEHTDIAGHQFIPVDTSFAIQRTDLFPYFYLKRPLFKILGYPLTGNAIFRRSITRPGYDALNPYPKFVDPYTFDVGNTKLQPQFTTNYELNATYNDFPVFAIGVNHTKDIFSKVTYQDETSKIAYRSYDNLGKNKEIYGRLFGGLPAGGKYFMYVGVQFNYVQYDGSYQNLPLHYNKGSWTFFTGHDVKATKTININVNAWMYANGFRSFYELKNMGQVNASITKAAFNRKLSIILSGADIFKTNISTFHLQQGTVLADGRRVQDSRRFGITLRYNFGIVRKEEKKPGFTQPADPVDTN